MTRKEYKAIRRLARLDANTDYPYITHPTKLRRVCASDKAVYDRAYDKRITELKAREHKELLELVMRIKRWS